jgi:heme-degrading monooxygenase HmoA
MQATMWRFVVKPGKEKAFEEMYGPGGLWAALFHESRAYHGTILVRSRAEPRAYTLLDFWDHREDYDAFKEKFAEPFAALDHEGEKLTEREEQVGWFDDIETF